MNTSIESYLKAASTYNGAGFVKLDNEKNQQAVQYGGRFFARNCGWFKKPSAEQNAAVRSNLLQTLAESPENFSAKAINAAARALGMQGDETLQIANSPLSKREVVEIINQTRVFDRNEALGLNGISREDVPAGMQDEFDRLMSGGTNSEAEHFVTELNSSRYSADQIQAMVSERMDQPDCAGFRDLKDQIGELCHGSFLTACANLGHVGSADEIRTLLENKIQKKVEAKINTGRMIETLSDPAKTAAPFSAAQKEFLLGRLAQDAQFSSPGYVNMLHTAGNCAVDLHRALDKEDCSLQEMADAFKVFQAAEQAGLKEMQGEEMGGNETMSMHQDLLHLSAFAMDKPQTEFFTATIAAQEQFEKLFAAMDFLVSQDGCLPGVTLPEGGFPPFATMIQLEQLFCADVDPLEYDSMNQIDDVTRNLVKHFGVNIQDLEPFGKGEVSGEYSSRLVDYVLSDLTADAEKKIRADRPDCSLVEVVGAPGKDIHRGQGLSLGGRVVNAPGSQGTLNEKELADVLEEFFTRDGQLDRKAMVSLCSFMHQGFQGLMLILGPKMGLGPLPDSLSTQGHVSNFDVSRNNDGSYSISYRCDIDHIECMGDFGTPNFVPLDGDNAGNRFHSEIGFRMAFDGDKPVFSLEQTPKYSYDLEARHSPEEISQINQNRIEENSIPEYVSQVVDDYIAENNYGELAPLSDDEKAEIRESARENMNDRTLEGILTKDKCRACITSAAAPMLYQKAKILNARRCGEAIAGKVFSSAVDETLGKYPQFAGLRDLMVQDLEETAKTDMSGTYLKVYTPEDIRAEVLKKTEAVLSRKQACLELLDKLAEPDADGKARISGAARDCLRNAVQNSLSIQNEAYLQKLIDHQDAFLPMLKMLAGKDTAAQDLMAVITENAATAGLIMEDLGGEAAAGAAGRTELTMQLLELSRIAYETENGQKPAVSPESAQLVRRTIADLQHVVYQYATKPASERASGPVHGSDDMFENLQKDLVSLQFLGRALVPDLPDRIEDTPDFSGLSAQTRMYLMDAGLCMDNIEGLAHGRRGPVGEQFCRALAGNMSDYARTVQHRSTDSSAALEEMSRDLGRHGTGVTINGTELSSVNGTTAKDEVVKAFEALCTPAGENSTPDLPMIRTCGALLHQGLGAMLGENMKKNGSSPYRGTLLGGHITTFDITGDMEHGLHVDYKIHVSAAMQVGINDIGSASGSYMMKDGSGWGAEFSFELKKNADGEVEVSVFRPVELDFRVDPQI